MQICKKIKPNEVTRDKTGGLGGKLFTHIVLYGFPCIVGELLMKLFYPLRKNIINPLYIVLVIREGYQKEYSCTFA